MTDWAGLADAMVGTTGISEATLERFGVDVDAGWDIEDIEEHLLDFNVETCPACGWWVESYDLEMDESGEVIGPCSNCA